MENRKIVAALIDQGNNQLFSGNPQEAFVSFLEALGVNEEKSGLLGECLINIGDWMRRVKGNLDVAHYVFDMVDTLRISLVTRSRLQSMRAMAWRYPSERGESDPEGIARCLFCLRQAITLAQRALNDETEDTQGALGAESLAIHRWGGTVSAREGWCTVQQQKEWLLVKRQFLPKLDSRSPEVARLNRCEALIIQQERPLEAARLLVESSELIQESSPLDATGYRLEAGILYAQNGDLQKARNCYEHTEAWRARFSQYAVLQDSILPLLDQLKLLLGR